MNPRARRFAILLCPLLLLAACGPSGQQRTTRRLNDRLQEGLAADITAGSAALQPLPKGARVTLLGTSSFPNDVTALAGQYTDIRANVIEGLLDPSLMRVEVTDTSPLPDQQREARVRNVDEYFISNGLGSTLEAAPPPQAVPPGPAVAAPPGLTITIGVQCLQRHEGTGYGSGRSMPVCD
jgi:hypothetical protein